MSVSQQPFVEHHEEREQKVTPLELFFDLVFVFGFTQVTAYLAAQPDFGQLGRGLLILASLWWAWVGYSWLTNWLGSDEGLARISLMSAMGAMLVVALAVPGAFGDDEHIFAVAYLIVRQLQIVALWLTGRHEPAAREAIRRLALTSAAGPGLILLGSFLDELAQYALWSLALVIDYFGGLFATRRAGEWHVHAGHFAERHALVIIMALGESIVALGVGAEKVELDADVILAAALGIALACALWWAYFDVAAIEAEHRLKSARGAARGELARDSYSYLHLMLVGGVIMLALGVKKTLGDAGHPLKDMPAVAMCVGTAVYFVGHVLFRLRTTGTVGWPRIVAAAVLIALIPLARELDALATLTLVTLVAVGVVAFESLRYAEARDHVRHDPSHRPEHQHD